jgi:hypothetical protein
MFTYTDFTTVSFKHIVISLTSAKGTQNYENIVQYFLPN